MSRDILSKGLNLPSIEEGVWTPTIQDPSFSDAEGQSYSTQFGTYTKIGNLVFIGANITMTGLGTLSGDIVVANLPFTSSPGTIGSGINCYRGQVLNITAGQSVSGFIGSSVTYITLTLWNTATGTSAMTAAELTAGGLLELNGVYNID